MLAKTITVIGSVWGASTVATFGMFLWHETWDVRARRRIRKLTQTPHSDQPKWVKDCYAFLAQVDELEATYELPSREHTR